MRRKLKICFRIFLIILVTVACVFAGFQTRHKKAIKVTGFGNSEGELNAGYLLEAETGRLIMIDGGGVDESETVLNEIKSRGGVVEVWFITLPYKERAQVLLDALEDDEIEVGGIYLSINGKDWYDEFENVSELDFVKEFIDTIESDSVRDRVHDLHAKDELNLDNLNFKILKVKHPEYTENAGANQSLVIRVSNNFKSVVFLGGIGTEYEKDLINDNQDEIQVKNINSIENKIENYMTGIGNSTTVEIY